MDNNSRVDKFEKRRKNTKSISLFLVAGGILLIVLLAMFLFGGDEEKVKDEQSSTDSQSENSDDNSTNEDSSKNETKNETTSDENDETTSDESSSSDDTASSDAEEENQEEEKSEDEDEEASDDIEKETVEGSDDPNVLEAYTANWEPIGTEQEGTHTKKFAEGTQDRIEMEEAIRVATGLKQGDMITWWLENGGGNDVIGTVSNKAQDKTYRVYLTWVENKGWKPTKVEVLKENDKD